jgi:arylsulfatase B
VKRLLLALLMGCAALPMRSERADEPPPDILIVIWDDVGSADLALYGGAVATPNLDSLAAAGVTFTRAYANPMCAPSRLSLLTGVWAITTTGEPCDPLGPETPSLAFEFLPKALPHTSGLVGKWHLGTDPLGGPWEIAPIRHGFDNWIAGHAGNVGHCGGTNYGTWERVNANGSFYSSAIVNTYEPVAVRDAFNLGWNGTASPKFAVVSGQLAHGPFHVPPPPYYSGPPPGSTRARFEAMIQANDFILGQMLANVDLETTLVILVGDNGTPGQAAPNPDKAKFTSYERGVRVPMVVAGAGITNPGRISSELVHAVDVWATAIEAGGGTAPGGSPRPIRSVSLGPILRDEVHAAPHAQVLVGHNWGHPGDRGNRAAVSASGIKLLQWDDDGDTVVDREELYDLTADALETSNLIASPSYASDLAAARAFIAAEAP